MVSNRCPCSRSTFSEPNRVSLHALSQQLPLRLIDGVIPHCFSTLLKSSLAYWLPRSLWEISSAFPSGRLHQPENTLLLLVTCTGMRCSEALGLKWQDIEPDRKLINVRWSWSMDKEGKPKPKASEAPVACIPALAEHLAAWRRESVYSRDEDRVFPSYKNKGRTPRSGSSLVKDYIRAAAVRAGVIKPGDKRPFGLHVLRHSLATSLISWGTDVKTVQGMMRHANPQTTLESTLSRWTRIC